MNIFRRLWLRLPSPTLHTNRDLERVCFDEVATEQTFNVLDVGVGTTDGKDSPIAPRYGRNLLITECLVPSLTCRAFAVQCWVTSISLTWGSDLSCFWASGCCSVFWSFCTRSCTVSCTVLCAIPSFVSSLYSATLDASALVVLPVETTHSFPSTIFFPYHFVPLLKRVIVFLWS